jgi:capsular polysaccharide transport system permease protein
MHAIIQDFRLQFRVITALFLRELHTRFGRANLGYLWMVGEPMMFCVGVTIMWSAIRPASEHGVPVTAFVITGYVPLTMWRHCVGRSVKAFESNGSLLFHRQVTPLDIIAARLILEIYGACITFVLLSAAAMLLGYMEPPANLGLVYLGLMYEILFCIGTALIFASLSEQTEAIEKTISVISYLSLPFSGAFTMVDWVPIKFQSILLYSPQVHGFEMIRKGWFGSAVTAHYDIFYTTWLSFVLVIIGLALTLRVKRYIVIQ